MTLDHPYSNTDHEAQTAVSKVEDRLQRVVFLTLVGPLRFTSHLSNPIAIAVTAVVNVMDGFVPGFSNLVEFAGLWLLTLICCNKTAENNHYHQTGWKQGEVVSCVLAFWFPKNWVNEPWTHQEHHTSNVHVPVHSKCSSSCSPHHAAWRIPGLLHSTHCQQCTGLDTQKKEYSKQQNTLMPYCKYASS